MFRALILAAGLGAAAAGTASATTLWTTHDLNLRDGPGTSWHVIRVIPACSPVTLLRGGRGWVPVAWRHHEGWVSTRYLSDRPARHCAQSRAHPPRHQAAPPVVIVTPPPGHPPRWSRAPRWDDRPRWDRGPGWPPVNHPH